MKAVAAAICLLGIILSMGAITLALAKPIEAEPKLYVCTEVQRGHCVAYKEYQK